MDTSAIKFRLIYLPYLYFAAGSIGVYTFLNWLLVIHTGLISIKEDVVNIFIPMAVIYLFLQLCLRPRIKLLNMKDKNGKNSTGVYVLAAWASIAIPAAITQQYLVTATGKLTALPSIEALNSKPLTKYYTLQHCYIDSRHIAVYSKTSVTGKHNRSFKMDIYIACPVLSHAPADMLTLNSKSDTLLASLIKSQALMVIDGVPIKQEVFKRLNSREIKTIEVLRPGTAGPLYGTLGAKGVILISLVKRNPALPFATLQSSVNLLPKAWLGVTYSETISNSDNGEQKQAAFKDFALKCQRDLETRRLNNFIYLDRIGNTDDRDSYIAAINNAHLKIAGPPVIFEAKNEPFEARNGQNLLWIISSFIIGAGFWLLMLASAFLNPEKVSQWQTDKSIPFK